MLFLAHRMPYPPNKGDKIRSFHLLRHLSQRYRIYLGSFIDDAADAAHVSMLNEWCEEAKVVRLRPAFDKLLAFRGLATGEALSLPYFRDAGLKRWIEATVRREGIRKAVVYCSTMAQYLDDLPELVEVVDFVDVDSAKWSEYAQRHRGPLSWLYRREARHLLDFERRVALRASASALTTPAEVELFESLAPDVSGRVSAIANGVDAGYFSPERRGASPYDKDEWPIVFTGAMDYLPNADAASWFAQEVMPLVRAQQPKARFYVVGMNPTSRVRSLERLGFVTVTGRVADVRPYVGYAKVAVAPLRVARGIQNKVLEAMAMASAVVASKACAGGIDAHLGVELMCADDADQFAQAVLAMRDEDLASAMGNAARRRVLDGYSWQANLSLFDRLLERGASPVTGAVPKISQVVHV